MAQFANAANVETAPSRQTIERARRAFGETREIAPGIFPGRPRG
jgi:hypothetical protein